MGIDDLTIITHTHTDCKTLWSPYFDSYYEFFNHKKHIVLINKFSDEITNNQIVYSDSTKYSNRLSDCLNDVNTNYILISFEDMILYDKVKVDELDNIIKIMSKNEDYLYTRLIKSGIKSNLGFKDNLYITDNSDFLFSITPTIWRKKDLLNLLKELQDLSIWDLEINGDFLFKTKGIKGLYYYNNDSVRGGHYNSSIYPHICSAIVKGRWNLTEYSDILLPIIKKYKININEKGIF